MDFGYYLIFLCLDFWILAYRYMAERMIVALIMDFGL